MASHEIPELGRAFARLEFAQHEVANGPLIAFHVAVVALPQLESS